MGVGAETHILTNPGSAPAMRGKSRLGLSSISPPGALRAQQTSSDPPPDKIELGSSSRACLFLSQTSRGHRNDFCGVCHKIQRRWMLCHNPVKSRNPTVIADGQCLIQGTNGVLPHRLVHKTHSFFAPKLNIKRRVASHT